jgi:hypothetical protein
MERCIDRIVIILSKNVIILNNSDSRKVLMIEEKGNNGFDNYTPSYVRVRGRGGSSGNTKSVEHAGRYRE